MIEKEEFYFEPHPEVHEYPGCCGIEVVTYFDLTKWHKSNWGAVEPKLTLKEWHEKAYKRILKQRNCKHVQLSLVKSYKLHPDKEQVPGFISFLKKKKWKTIAEFVNPNHGNTVIVLGKTFAKEGKGAQDYNDW
jgi:hypothetical protein